MEVVENTQLIIYAIGAMQRAGWVNDEVEVVIAQPRYRDSEAAPVRRWLIPEKKLKEYLALIKKGISECMDPLAPCKPGPWCDKSFCPARGVCPALRKEVVEVVDEESTALRFPEPASLTPEQMAKVLEASDLISSWAKGVRAHALQMAKETGVNLPGYKLIRKYGNRTWIDEMAVENEFEHEFGDAIYEKKLKSPAKLEKVVGKDRVKELYHKPEKGIDLVPESAKGEALNESPDKVFEKIEKGGE